MKMEVNLPLELERWRKSRSRTLGARAPASTPGPAKGRLFAEKLLPFRNLMGKLENLHGELSAELNKYFLGLVNGTGSEMLCKLGTIQNLSAREFAGKEVINLARVQKELFDCIEALDEATSICAQLEAHHLEEADNET